ncbi:hypothetical protein BDR03DRAFT_881588, partial [Suillus americanus]
KDPLSKFWAAYKILSDEYDDDMLERCNGNMDIVLIFAGLFSAVNTAFIIAIQLNSIDTTINILKPALTSSKFWMQALAYASLGLNLLAAYGTVMGKQWLSHYKTTRFGCGFLKD